MTRFLTLAALAATVTVTATAPSAAPYDRWKDVPIKNPSLEQVTKGPAFEDMEERVIIVVPGVVRPPVPIPGPGPLCLSCPPFPIKELRGLNVQR
jgi:hypothetical protein